MSAEDLKQLRLDAARQATEITDILQTVPSELILLLKTKFIIKSKQFTNFFHSDLLRSVTSDLSSDVNPYLVNLQYCQRAVNQDAIMHGKYLQRRVN